MAELFKNVIYLTCAGSAVTIILSFMVLIFRKKLSGRVQKILWVVTLLSFTVPVWSFVPQIGDAPVVLPYNNLYEFEENEYVTDQYEEIAVSNEGEGEEAKITAEIDISKVIPLLWFGGMCIFLLLNTLSYTVFLSRKRKNGIIKENNPVFEEVSRNMGIKRKIKLRECSDFDSPFLTGVLFPVIYLPEQKYDEAAERLIYIHELTHYRHKDLIIKWFTAFVNAIHWFNPLCYIVTRNINHACELDCDRAVTRNMTDEEKKLYMNTILNLVAKKG